MGTLTWDGGAGTNNWGDANNWNPDLVPTSSNDVSLTGANTIDVNVAGVCNNITLNNASLVLTVKSAYSLTVSGNLTAHDRDIEYRSLLPHGDGIDNALGRHRRLHGCKREPDGRGKELREPDHQRRRDEDTGRHDHTERQPVRQWRHARPEHLHGQPLSGRRHAHRCQRRHAQDRRDKQLPLELHHTHLGATSTVEYGGTNQSVTAETYGHLTFSTSGTKTFAAGTTGIAGTFTISGSASADATTNSATVDYNGSGAQTVRRHQLPQPDLEQRRDKDLCLRHHGHCGHLHHQAAGPSADATTNSATIDYNGSGAQNRQRP